MNLVEKQPNAKRWKGVRIWLGRRNMELARTIKKRLYVWKVCKW
jgi:hypothetical protein